MITAIIPARGGSKGIPGKNLIDMCGKPLIAWTIEQALAASVVDHVIVATDSNEIGACAEEYGALYFERSLESSTDTAQSEVAILEVLDGLAPQPDLVVFLQATSPIRQPGDIDSAVRRLQLDSADSLFSARHVEGFIWKQSDRFVLSPEYSTRLMRQALKTTTLEENGSIYVFKPSILRKYNARLGGVVTVHMMHVLDSFQLDVLDDIEILESLMRLRLDACCGSATN